MHFIIGPGALRCEGEVGVGGGPAAHPHLRSSVCMSKNKTHPFANYCKIVLPPNSQTTDAEDTNRAGGCWGGGRGGMSDTCRLQ